MNSKLTLLLALLFVPAAASHAQVLMLDFGPTATTAASNSPYHTAYQTENASAFSGTTWNTIGVADVSSGLKYADNSDATGVTVNVGAKTSATDLTMSAVPSGNSAMGTVVNTGVYAGTSVGTDGIFTGSVNTTATSVGLQIGGLNAGTYDVYLVTRNTSRASTSNYSQVGAVGTSSTSGDFNFSGYSSGTLSYANSVSPVATSDWGAGANYLKLSVTISSGDFLNIAVHGGGEDLRGFLNSVQIVNTSAIPEPGTCALLGGAAVLGAAGVRRRRL